MKWGKDRDGHQRYRCRDCRKTTIDKPADSLGRMRVDPDRAAFALRLLLEGMSIRATARMTGIDRNTLYDLILTVGENCERLLAAAVRSVPAAEVECDELWSPVFCKERVRALRGYGEEVGDCYTFVGIDRATKLVLTYHVGRRTFVDADRFCRKLRIAVGGRPAVYTDGFKPYRSTVRHNFWGNVDHGVLVKKYGSTPDGDGAQRRYSPAAIIGIDKQTACGEPDHARLCTSHVERMNLSIRMGLRRFTRLTNGFSKSRRHHAAMLGLFFAYFNFAKRHQTLRTTPAVAAGITSEVWTVERLLVEAARVAA